MNRTGAPYPLDGQRPDHIVGVRFRLDERHGDVSILLALVRPVLVALELRQNRKKYNRERQNDGPG